MDECLFWRSNVTQTTCFLDKMSSRTKQEPCPFLPTTTRPTTRHSQLGDYGRPHSSVTTDQFVWCRLNSWQWRYFQTPPCAQSCCSCNPDVGLVCYHAERKKCVSYNVKKKKNYLEKNVFDQLVFISQVDHTCLFHAASFWFCSKTSIK